MLFIREFFFIYFIFFFKPAKNFVKRLYNLQGLKHIIVLFYRY